MMQQQQEKKNGIYWSSLSFILLFIGYIYSDWFIVRRHFYIEINAFNMNV